MEEMNPEQFTFNLKEQGAYVGKITRKGSTFLPKVLLFLCAGICVTFLVAFLIPYIIHLSTGNFSKTLNFYLIAAGIAGGIGIMITSIVLMISQLKNKKGSITLFFIYATLMGLTLSPLYLLTLSDIGVLGLLYSLLVTAGIFLIMGILGMLLKGKVHFLVIFASSLVLGSLILTLVNLFLFNETIYWIVSFALLGGTMLYTAIDFYRISQIGKYGEETISEIVGCAFCLFNDFIILFLRVLPFILKALARR